MRFRRTKYLYLLLIILLFSFLTSIEFTSAERRTDTTDICVSGNLAYVYVMNDGLQIINISNPNDPQFVSHLKLPYHFSHYMQKESNYLYFLAHNPTSDHYEIHIIDVSNPKKPDLIGNYKKSGGDIDKFYLKDNLLFVQIDKLEIVDVSNPHSPTKVGEYSIESVYDICFRDDKAFILTELDGMQILDISTPGTPTLIKSYDNITGYYISLDSTYAIISNYFTIHIYDVSNILDISFVSMIEANGLVGHFVCEDVIYYETSGSRIGMIDFSYPSSLSAIAVYYPSESINGMCVVDHIIYIAADDAGMLILDMNNPLNPLKLSYYEIYLPFIRTRNLILISISAAILVGIVAIPIWRRDQIKERIEQNRIKRETGPPPKIHRAIKISLISSAGVCLTSIALWIGLCAWDVWVGLILLYTLLPGACLFSLITIITTVVVTSAKKKQKITPTEISTEVPSEVVQEKQEGMIFCSSCGKQISAEYKHCPKCGYNL